MVGLVMLAAVATDARAQSAGLSAAELYHLHESGQLKRNSKARLHLTGKVYSVKPIGMGIQTPVVHLTVNERAGKTVQVEGLPTRYLGWLRQHDPVRFVCERIRGSDPTTLYVAGCRVDRSGGDPEHIEEARRAVKRLKDEPWDVEKCEAYQSAGYLACRYDRAMSRERTGHDSLGNAMWRQCDGWLKRYHSYCPTVEETRTQPESEGEEYKAMLDTLARLLNATGPGFADDCNGQLRDWPGKGEFAGHRLYNCTYIGRKLGLVTESLDVGPRGVVQSAGASLSGEHVAPLVESIIETAGKPAKYVSEPGIMDTWIWGFDDATLSVNAYRNLDKLIVEFSR
jgi:hypothetical protein